MAPGAPKRPGAPCLRLAMACRCKPLPRRTRPRLAMPNPGLPCPTSARRSEPQPTRPNRCHSTPQRTMPCPIMSCPTPPLLTGATANHATAHRTAPCQSTADRKLSLWREHKNCQRKKVRYCYRTFPDTAEAMPHALPDHAKPLQAVPSPALADLTGPRRAPASPTTARHALAYHAAPSHAEPDLTTPWRTEPQRALPDHGLPKHATPDLGVFTLGETQRLSKVQEHSLAGSRHRCVQRPEIALVDLSLLLGRSVAPPERAELDQHVVPLAAL